MHIMVSYLLVILTWPFEHGLITFSDLGEMLFAPHFSDEDRRALAFPVPAKLTLLSDPTRS